MWVTLLKYLNGAVGIFFAVTTPSNTQRKKYLLSKYKKKKFNKKNKGKTSLTAFPK